MSGSNRICLALIVGVALSAGCGDTDICEEYPNLCAQGGTGATGGGGSTSTTGGAPGGGGTTTDGGSGGTNGGGGEGGSPECPMPCEPGDENTTAACVDGQCEYTCMPDFGDCDEDETTCETSIATDGNCGACGVDCAYDECVLIDAAYACNDPIEIEAEDDANCAIKRDGSIWCWGANNFGQLGINTGISINSSPLKITVLPQDFRAVELRADDLGACAKSQDGQFACWPPAVGNNQSTAQLVTGTNLDMVFNFDFGGGGGAGLQNPGQVPVTLTYDSGIL